MCHLKYLPHGTLWKYLPHGTLWTVGSRVLWVSSVRDVPCVNIPDGCGSGQEHSHFLLVCFLLEESPNDW